MKIRLFFALAFLLSSFCFGKESKESAIVLAKDIRLPKMATQVTRLMDMFSDSGLDEFGYTINDLITLGQLIVLQNLHEGKKASEIGALIDKLQANGIPRGQLEPDVAYGAIDKWLSNIKPRNGMNVKEAARRAKVIARHYFFTPPLKKPSEKDILKAQKRILSLLSSEELATVFPDKKTYVNSLINDYVSKGYAKTDFTEKEMKANVGKDLLNSKKNGDSSLDWKVMEKFAHEHYGIKPSELRCYIDIERKPVFDVIIAQILEDKEVDEKRLLTDLSFFSDQDEYDLVLWNKLRMYPQGTIHGRLIKALGLFHSQKINDLLWQRIQSSKENDTLVETLEVLHSRESFDWESLRKIVLIQKNSKELEFILKSFFSDGLEAEEKKVSKILQQFLKSEDSYLRSFSLEVMRADSPVVTSQRLIEIVEKDKDMKVKKSAMKILCKTASDPTSWSYIDRLLKESSDPTLLLIIVQELPIQYVISPRNDRYDQVVGRFQLAKKRLKEEDLIQSIENRIKEFQEERRLFSAKTSPAFLKKKLLNWAGAVEKGKLSQEELKNLNSMLEEIEKQLIPDLANEGKTRELAREITKIVKRIRASIGQKM